MVYHRPIWLGLPADSAGIPPPWPGPGRHPKNKEKVPTNIRYSDVS